MFGAGAAGNRDAAARKGRAQRLGGKQGGVFDSDEQFLPAVAQRDGAPELGLPAAGDALEFDAALAARGDCADAVVDAVELDGRRKSERGGFADGGAGADGESLNVIGQGESGNRRPVVRLGIVHSPAAGVGLPRVPGVVAGDAAFDAAQSAGHELPGKVLDRGERIPGNRAHAVGDGAGGEIRVAAAIEAEPAADAALRIGRGLGQYTGLESMLRTQAREGERGAEEFDV